MKIPKTRSSPPAKPPFKIALKSKIVQITKVATAVLFVLSMAIFQAPATVIGFIAGVAFAPQAKDLLSRVQRIWHAHPWEVVGATALCALVAFPIVFIASAVGTGIYLGVRFADRSRPGMEMVKHV